jgi:hypothetical protein
MTMTQTRELLDSIWLRQMARELSWPLPSFMQRRPLPKSYGGAPARRKASGQRARKRALYQSITGIQTLRIRAPYRYVRIV